MIMNSPLQPSIAYILKGFPRISETFIANEILLLERLGYRLRLFPMRLPRETFCHESVKQISAPIDYLPTELVDDFPRLIISNIFCAVSRPARYRAALALAARRFRRTRSVATGKHLLQAGYLTQKHLAKDPSIVHLHGHFAHSPTSVTMFASQLSGLPFSFTAHAKDIYTSDRLQLQEKIDRAAFVTTCTKHNKRYLASLSTESTTPIHCLYHGIDLSLFSPPATRDRPAAPYRLLTIARLTEKKGLPTVYRALKTLSEQQIPFSHVLIGDGDDREQILAMIEQLELTAQCTWLGTQPHDRVLQHFQTSDLFILGCTIAGNGDRDGIPNVLVESLAMGVPAVSSNISSIPEILIDGQTGLTVEPGDSDALAGAMLRLLTDQELRRHVIRTGQDYVRRTFDNTQLVARLADCFRAANPLLHGAGAGEP